MEYKLVSETLNTNINRLKTDYLKTGHLLPKAYIFKKRTTKKSSSIKKKSKSSKLKFKFRRNK